MTFEDYLFPEEPVEAQQVVDTCQEQEQFMPNMDFDMGPLDFNFDF